MGRALGTALTTHAPGTAPDLFGIMGTSAQIDLPNEAATEKTLLHGGQGHFLSLIGELRALPMILVLIWELQKLKKVTEGMKRTNVVKVCPIVCIDLAMEVAKATRCQDRKKIPPLAWT